MKKELMLLIVILFLIYGCSQADETIRETPKERLADGNYSGTATGHMVPGDYSSLEKNIDVLLQSGNMIGSKHYDELEASVNKLESQGMDVSKLREKLAKLNVAPRQGEDGSKQEVHESENSQVEQTKPLDQTYESQVKHTENLKSIQNAGYTERIDVSDGVAGSLSRDRVISVINIENPESPSIKGAIETNGFAEAVHKDAYYYVGGSDEFKILQEIGKDPIGTYEQHNWISALAVAQGYAYLASGDKMLILDVKDTKNIRKASEISLTGRAPSDIILKDGYAFVVETLGGLNILDVTNPLNPKVVKVIPFESHTAGFDIAGNYAYIGRIVSTKSGTQGYSQTSVFEIVDISAPASARVVSSIEIPTDIRDVDVDGKYAYVMGSFPYRLSVIDVASPGNPAMLKTEEVISGSADLQDIVVENGYAFIADGINGLKVIDVSNPAKPQHVKDFGLQGRAFNVYKSGNELFVGVEKKYFNLADVSNPEEPKQVYSESFTSSYEYTSIVIGTKRLFFNAGGARVYDISNPKSPQQLNKAPINADSIQIQGKYLYSTIGEIGLLVYDISNLASPAHVSTTPFPMGIPRDLSVDGKWAVGISNSPYSISVFDVSNPEKPAAGQSYKYEKYPDSVTVKGSYAYVARAEDGTDIIRINNDGSLELVKNIPSSGRYVHHVTVSGNKAFVLKDGADIYDISDPKNPVFLEHISSNGQAVRADVDNGYIYFADGYAGVTIAKIEG